MMISQQLIKTQRENWLIHETLSSLWSFGASTGLIITSVLLTPTFLSSSPTMFRAEILADVVRGVPERLSPAETNHLMNADVQVSNDIKQENISKSSRLFGIFAS